MNSLWRYFLPLWHTKNTFSSAFVIFTQIETKNENVLISTPLFSISPTIVHNFSTTYILLHVYYSLLYHFRSTKHKWELCFMYIWPRFSFSTNFLLSLLRNIKNIFFFFHLFFSSTTKEAIRRHWNEFKVIK